MIHQHQQLLMLMNPIHGTDTATERLRLSWSVQRFTVTDRPKLVDDDDDVRRRQRSTPTSSRLHDVTSIARHTRVRMNAIVRGASRTSNDARA